MEPSTSPTPRSPNSSRRRESFHSPTGGFHTSLTTQQRRREHALELQKQRRTHAFEQARKAHMYKDPIDLDLMNDMSITSSSNQGQFHDASDSDEENSISNPADADGDDPQMSSFGLSATTSPTTDNKVPMKLDRKKRSKSVYKPWARNLLMHAEMLDLSSGLPEGFFRGEWSVQVCPIGKRCLCATSNNVTGTNTILYSRVSGRTLARLLTPLPGDCLIDAVHDPDTNTLWIMDLIKWSGVYYVDHDHVFRKWFLTSRLSEISPFAQSSIELKLVPTLAAPFQPDTLATFLQLAISDPQTDGLLFYLNSARYESGSTPLVGWVPNIRNGNADSSDYQISTNDKGHLLLTRLLELVELARGGMQAI